jgi:2-methylfumaryl-CoA isomerase
MFSTVNQPGAGRYLAANSPLRFSALEAIAAKPAPVLGEHTEQVLYELLGTTTAEYGRLLEQRVVCTAALS